MVSVVQLQRIMPRAKVRAVLYLVYLNEAMAEFEINTPLRQAAFLATLAHESGQLRYMEEIADGSAYDDREDLGNTQPEAIKIAFAHNSTPGRWFKGRCPIQITGYLNYVLYGKKLGLDLLNNPELLCNPAHAFRASAAFWDENKINELADIGDFDGVSDEVNRGRKTKRIGDSNGWKERLSFYEAAKEVLL